MEILNVEFYITGTKFHDYAKVADQLQLDDLVYLQPDPSNEYDANAVKIIWQGRQLGWVPQKSGESKVVAEALKAGLNLEAIISVLKPDSSWRQVKVWICSDGVPRSHMLNPEEYESKRAN